MIPAFPCRPAQCRHDRSGPPAYHRDPAACARSSPRPVAFAGAQLGQSLSYAIAWLTDHDIAELKDMLIWSVIAGIAIGATAGFWIVMVLAPTQRWIQRSRARGPRDLGLGGTAMMIAAYDWPKTLRPSGACATNCGCRPALRCRLQVKYGWVNGKARPGTASISTGPESSTDERRFQASFAIDRHSKGSDMALGWAPNIESRWRIPYHRRRAAREAIRPLAAYRPPALAARAAPYRYPRASITSAIASAATCDVAAAPIDTALRRR